MATALNQNKIKKNAGNARNFVLELEQTIENITPKQVNTIRTYLNEKQKTTSESLIR
ncbi:hypothetical protein G4O51_04035 [Candidatus Bathyarchaeota archaeon A05DMB-2]|nr:hypothetical protein [Candidatus Bathyarchaeota archaeon A05DMB-2]